MTLRKQVKYNAKRCLCNNWGKAISIVLLNTAVYLLFAIIEMMIAQLLELPIGDSTILMSVSGAHTLSFILSLLMSIGSFLLMVPLNLGIMRWYHSLSDGVSEDIMGIFSCFANRKMFFRSLWLSLNTGVRIALTAVLYLFLPTVGFVLSSFLLSSHLSEALFLGSLSLVFSAVLFLLMGGFFLMRIQRYFLPNTTCWMGRPPFGKPSAPRYTPPAASAMKFWSLSFPSCCGRSPRCWCCRCCISPPTIR